MISQLKDISVMKINILKMLFLTALLSACATSPTSKNSANLSQVEQYPNQISICRNPTFVGVGIYVGVDLKRKRIANLSSLGDKIVLGASEEDIINIYVPSQLGSLVEKPMVKFYAPKGRSFILVENQMDWARGVAAAVIGSTRAQKNGGNKGVETAIALDEINSELKEINGNKYVGVRNIDDEKYIFKGGNWAVKITSEGKFKTDCNVNNSK